MTANLRFTIMRYDKDRQWVRNVLKTVDVSNTFNGGMSKPRLSFKIHRDHYLITATNPGVEPYDFNAEVIGDQLIIYHSLNFGEPFDPIEVPHVVGVYKLRKDVDSAGIYGEVKDGILEITMPRTDHRIKHFDRAIDIY